MSAEIFPSPGDGYQERIPSTWALNPATGLAWSPQALAAASIVYEHTTLSGALPRLRLSTLDGYAETEFTPEVGRSATGATLARDASASDPGKPTATAVSSVPTATAVVLTRTATAQAITPPRGYQS